MAETSPSLRGRYAGSGLPLAAMAVVMRLLGPRANNRPLDAI
ncbi:hypothetical protein [Pseudonocardia aurantiaca]|uniref:Uncharacterized protein n=1 Tax=Pseudonocardia aurantiaca TaxID=75290 RepID=A0ABW4FHT6_9PSEU